MEVIIKVIKIIIKVITKALIEVISGLRYYL